MKTRTAPRRAMLQRQAARLMIELRRLEQRLARLEREIAGGPR